MSDIKPDSLSSDDQEMVELYKTGELRFSILPEHLKKHIKNELRPGLTPPNKFPKNLSIEKYVKKLDEYKNDFQKLSEDIKKDPYSYSKLSYWLSLDKWTIDEGMLILAGISPEGAIIQERMYENFVGAQLMELRIDIAGFFSDIGDDYTIPRLDYPDEIPDEKFDFSNDISVITKNRKDSPPQCDTKQLLQSMDQQ